MLSLRNQVRRDELRVRALVRDDHGLGRTVDAVDADIAEDSYDISATLRSSGILNLFERTNIQANASGLINAGAVRWQRYDLDHHYSRKHR